MIRQSPAPTELRTARLLLRPPRREDAEAYFLMASDPEYAVFGSRQLVTREGTERALAQIVAMPWAKRAEFAIVLGGAIVGRVMLDVDRRNAVAALGYGIARPHWGQGFASEAARAMLDYGFDAYELAKVWARADPRNLASIRVLEKLGMTREGLFRQQVLVRGQRADRAYYGILREEWAAARAARG